MVDLEVVWHLYAYSGLYFAYFAPSSPTHAQPTAQYIRYTVYIVCYCHLVRLTTAIKLIILEFIHCHLKRSIFHIRKYVHVHFAYRCNIRRLHTSEYYKINLHVGSSTTTFVDFSITGCLPLVLTLLYPSFSSSYLPFAPSQGV